MGAASGDRDELGIVTSLAEGAPSSACSSLLVYLLAYFMDDAPSGHRRVIRWTSVSFRYKGTRQTTGGKLSLFTWTPYT